MKKLLWTALLSGALNLTALGGVYTFNSGFQNSGVIPDGSLTGLADTRNINDLTGPITSVTVSLNISGGYNGDLIAYLSYNGVLVPLLNQVGTTGPGTFGYDNTGFQVTLTDSALNDIHNYQDNSPTYADNGALLGTWKPDGGSLSSFNTMGGNGNWTLFFADTTQSGDSSSVSSWTLDIITAVPEPINIALGVFAGLFIVGSVVRSESMRNLFRKPEPVDLD